MGELIVFTPGVDRQDLEHARWKGMDLDGFILPSAVTVKLVQAQPEQYSVEADACSHVPHALVSHEVMIESLHRSL